MIPRLDRRKPRCIRDHDLNDPANLRVNSNGWRYCVPCNRIVSQEWRDRQKQEKTDYPRMPI